MTGAGHHEIEIRRCDRVAILAYGVQRCTQRTVGMRSELALVWFGCRASATKIGDAQCARAIELVPRISPTLRPVSTDRGTDLGCSLYFSAQAAEALFETRLAHKLHLNMGRRRHGKRSVFSQHVSHGTTIPVIC